ncbi:ATP-grasp domain-containing protein [Rhodoligotrophos defluvii]|uniref:ATP-grasp domain-containing protein n=1 Tax=Rhodoligotrophos defluvii TaxID=2561934 RepID=UPI001EF09619|nr:ATP-grasp domain-containing protein [Rhodoligotrophos defluvii]
MDLLAREPFDILLPIHEQGLAFCRLRDKLPGGAAVALPSLEAYRQVHSKAGFSRVLSELGLPQPPTQFIETRQQALSLNKFPVVLKTSIGTASRGVWLVKDRESLRCAVEELDKISGFTDAVLAQDFIEGTVEHAQAVFSNGKLIGLHAYRQIVRGAGGGDAVKESIDRPELHDHLALLGEHLHWHGALSVDYLASEASGAIHYIDCNPRLVEPMNAWLAGHDLLDRLLQVTCADQTAPLPPGRTGIRSHLAMQALLGCALRSRSRWELLREIVRLVRGSGIYRTSEEELTPLRWDWPSVAPTVAVALLLLITPKAAEQMPKRGWGTHLLTPQSIRIICDRVG